MMSSFWVSQVIQDRRHEFLKELSAQQMETAEGSNEENVYLSSKSTGKIFSLHLFDL